MLHRIIGFILGGITIWVILTLGETFTPDTQPRYLAAIIVGLIVAALYPWAIGIWFVRRRKAKQNEEDPGRGPATGCGGALAPEPRLTAAVDTPPSALGGPGRRSRDASVTRARW